MAYTSLASGRNNPRRAGRLGLVLTIGLGLILSLINPRPTEQMPWHDHIVLGAHGLKEWAHALASHHHDRLLWGTAARTDVQPSHAGSTVGEEGTPRVLSIGQRADGAGTHTFHLGALLLADVRPLMRLAIPRSGRPVCSPKLCMLVPRPVPVADPPPRTSS